MFKKALVFLYKYILSGAGYRVSLNIKAISYLKRKNLILAKYLSGRLQRKYGVFISPRAEFDETLQLRHPVAVVIGEGVKLGKNVVIYQSVTLGGARMGDGVAGNYPEIGDDTIIFSGAAIVGAVKVGRNCVIGANSVVITDIPDNCTAAGVPARIIRKSK